MNRLEAIRVITSLLAEDDIVLSTTGMITRELNFAHDRRGNFYMIGSMGLTSSVGLGLAILNPDVKTFILEGDGSALMSLGTLPLIANESPGNLIHIILDNEAYESTGDQPTISSQVSLVDIGKASGYRKASQVHDEESLITTLRTLDSEPGPHLVVVKVAIAKNPDIPRVEIPPSELVERLQRFIASDG